MRVIKPRAAERAPSEGAIFVGTVRTQPVLEEGAFRVLEVTFLEGARTKLHRHSTDQVLVITAGSGIVGNERQRQSVGAGDVVYTPAGEAHFHGAAEGSDMTHFSMLRAGNETTILER